MKAAENTPHTCYNAFLSLGRGGDIFLQPWAAAALLEQSGTGGKREGGNEREHCKTEKARAFSVTEPNFSTSFCTYYLRI